MRLWVGRWRKPIFQSLFKKGTQKSNIGASDQMWLVVVYIQFFFFTTGHNLFSLYVWIADIYHLEIFELIT